MKPFLASLAQPIDIHIHRMVESQEKVATLNLVDTLEEQALLESVIEGSKPGNINLKRHYLLSTPFRYPPLKYGSRFGSRYEPSIFYGAHSVSTMLNEAAYYAFYFMSGMKERFEMSITSHKTSFQAHIRDAFHVDLSNIDNKEWQDNLTSKDCYQFGQEVGAMLREINAGAFSFTSARCPDKGLNTGVFAIESIIGNPKRMLEWEVKQTCDKLLFYCSKNSTLSQEVDIADFLVDGRLPKPSN